MSTKRKYSSVEEEKIIDFVRENEFLYNVKHPEYKNIEKKGRFWALLGEDMDRSGEELYKKWQNMRDYYVSKKSKLGSGTPVGFRSARDLSLSFLDKFHVRREKISSASSDLSAFSNECSETITSPEMPLVEYVECEIGQSCSSGSGNSNCSYNTYENNFGNRRTYNSTDSNYNEKIDILRKLVSQYDHPSPKLDNLDKFFLSIADTMKSFPPTEVATLKLKISQMVGEVELRLAIKQEQTE